MKPECGPGYNLAKMFLRFFRLGIFAFEIGERHIERLVTEAIWVGAEPGLNFRIAAIHELAGFAATLFGGSIPRFKND